MKKIAVRSRIRILGLVLAVGLTLAAFASPTHAVGDWSGCGDPYVRGTMVCIGWAPIIEYCWFEYEACANCDQGTACFAM